MLPIDTLIKVHSCIPIKVICFSYPLNCYQIELNIIIKYNIRVYIERSGSRSQFAAILRSHFQGSPADSGLQRKRTVRRASLSTGLASHIYISVCVWKICILVLLLTSKLRMPSSSTTAAELSPHHTRQTPPSYLTSSSCYS